MTDLIERLRKRSTAVYLATEEGPAKDISDHLREAADELERLQGYKELAESVETIKEFHAIEIAKLKAELERLQGEVEAYKQQLPEAYAERAKLEAIAEAPEAYQECKSNPKTNITLNLAPLSRRLNEALAAWRGDD